MRIGNWCRKLSAALVAGGLLVPAAVSAADLDTNLVANSGFENVDINSSEGGYNAVEILQWNDGSKVGFAYSHDGSLDGGGMVIPDYANGGPLAGGGSFYFTSNATPDDIGAAGEFSQNIDLSTGQTAATIAAGLATYQLSAFFSSFADDGDFGSVQVDFLDGGGGNVGSGLISDNDTTMWTQVATSGSIPVGTATARISLFGTPLSGGPDGYIDNVDFRVSAIPEPSTIILVGIAGLSLLAFRRRE